MHKKATLIRVIAIFVFRDGDRILVAKCADDVKQDMFARPLGAVVEFGETSVQAIVREIREELGHNATVWTPPPDVPQRLVSAPPWERKCRHKPLGGKADSP
jgi:8-oxo-dGTP pyrophosphatase MutT (NUDIX family)